MPTTRSDLAAEISALHELVRAALHEGLSPEDQDGLVQLVQTLRTVVGDPEPGPAETPGRKKQRGRARPLR
ncbi:MAG: hypothetical protein JO352_30150 [Chloroflexi bacterium]|nr:hypothetical protein [Chloroflexota bacterium]